MECTVNSTDSAKFFSCQVIKKRTSKPDSSDDAFETANECSDDDEDNHLIIRFDYEDKNKSSGSYFRRGDDKEN